MKKKIVAFLCVVTMLFGGIGSSAEGMVAKAEEGSYREYSFRDFGIYPGTISADTIGTVDGLTSLDGVALSGKVKFGSSWLMVGHESAENTQWSGIQMFVDEDGKSLRVSGNLFAEQALSKFSVGTGAGSSASETEEGYVKIDFDGTATWCDIGFSPIVANSEIHVFMNNDSDYPRYVQMNWTAATKVLKDGKDITEISAGATKIPANSGWVEVIYPVTEGSQFNCISRGTEGDVSVDSLLLKGYYVDERTEQLYGFAPSDSQIGSEEAGVDFANEYVDLRLTFDYTDTGVDMGVHVNEKFIKTISFGDDGNGSYNIKDVLGTYVMATGGFSSVATYRELTFADFGIEEGIVSSDIIGTNENISSLNGVAVSGKVKFGSSWLMLGHESATSGEWTGIQMMVNGENTGLKVSGHISGEVEQSGSEAEKVTLTPLPVTATVGSTCSTTEEGYIRIDYDGTTTWCDTYFDGITANQEIHLIMRNDSDTARIVSVDWNGASKVLNEEGEDVTASIVSGNNTVIPANSGWLEVVYPVTAASQINAISLSNVTGGEPINSVGSLYIQGYVADATYYQPVEKKIYAFAPSDSLISNEETGVDFANDFVNLRFTFDYTETGVDMGVSVNNNYIKTISFGASSDGVQNIKNCLGKYIMATGGMEIAKPDNQVVTDDIYCNLDLGTYTITEADTVTIDGETYAKGDSYSKVGVHTLSYSLLDKEYTRKLVVYRYGDLNDDSSVTLRDLMRMEKYLSAEVALTLTESALKGADMSCDAMVDEKDSNLLRDYLVMGEGVLVLSPAEGSTVALPSEAAAALLTNYQEGKADEIKTGKDIYYRTPVVLSWISPVKASEYTVSLATNPALSEAVTYTVTTPILSVDNLLADTTYYWQATAENVDTGIRSFHTADTIRTLTVKGVSNTRDGGGWTTVDGKMVKQGMFYRGGKLEGITEDGLAAMKALGIKTDLDLRNHTETSAAGSPLGEEVVYMNCSGPYYWTGSDGAGINTEAYREALVNEIRAFANEENYPIYVHCSLGRDRTGTLCFLINALCGVGEKELCMDYEFSFLSETGNLDGQTSVYMVSTFKNMYDNVKAYAPNGTMAEATESFMLSIGVTQEEINAIRNILLED